MQLKMSIASIRPHRLCLEPSSRWDDRPMGGLYSHVVSLTPGYTYCRYTGCGQTARLYRLCSCITSCIGAVSSPVLAPPTI